MSKAIKNEKYAYELFLLNKQMQFNVGTYYINSDHIPQEEEILNFIKENKTQFLDTNHYSFDTEYGYWTMLSCQKLLRIKNKGTGEINGHLTVSNIRKV